MSKTTAKLEADLEQAAATIVDLETKLAAAGGEERIAELEKENQNLLAELEEGLGGPDDIPEHGHAKHESKVERQARLLARC